MQDSLRKRLLEICTREGITDIRFSFASHPFESTGIYIFDYEGEAGRFTKSHISALFHSAMRDHGICSHLVCSDRSAKKLRLYHLDPKPYPKDSIGIFEDKVERVSHTQSVRDSASELISRSPA